MTESSVVNGDRVRFRKLPKILLHEHLDCSLRPETMLELWSINNFQWLPKHFPVGCAELWSQNEKIRAGKEYQQYLRQQASSSLAQYLLAIGNHVLPLMQTAENLRRFARERVEDAYADGIIVLHLRFAPQLHTKAGLTLCQVMEAVIAGISEAPLAVRLVLCTLRHEGVEAARAIAALARQFKEHVALVDLAGDEHAFPGIPQWWAVESARDAGLELTVHLWETEEPAEEDLVNLDQYLIKRLGHGIRGNKQADRLLEVCPSSNVLTGQVQDFAKHPIDSLFKAGRCVTVNTDGTLFTGSDLTNEYLLLNRHFGWGALHFGAVNKTALEASLLPEEKIQELSIILDNAYKEIAL